MFTGIIDHCAQVQTIEPTATGVKLEIKHEFNDLKLGESIAVDGVCLTVTADNKQVFSCDVSPETLSLTHLQHLKPNQAVNLERALRMQDRLGGHFVMGHVDGTWTVAAIEPHADFWLVSFNGVTPEQQIYLTHKGSITIQGVSLTLNKVTKTQVEVMLIPHTLERTNLQFLTVNQTVNIEFDTIARMVAKHMQLREEIQDV